VKYFKGITLETKADESKNLSKLYVSDFWGYSSVGRAVALQAIGLGFESPCLHQINQKVGLGSPIASYIKPGTLTAGWRISPVFTGRVAQLVRACA
jgi:hypothetical protein